jgi:hypothetical protein
MTAATLVNVPTASESDRFLSKWLGYVFLAAVFFPYLRVLPLGSDVQPMALVLGLGVLLASQTGRFPREITPLLVVLIGSVAIALVTGINVLAMRGLANYFSLFIIAFATYSTLKERDGFSTRLLSAVVWIWFTVGFLQTFVSRDLFTVFLSNARSTVGRGVVGLAPEPTSYGIHCLLLGLLVLDLCSGRQRRWNLAALFIQILFFARSSMSVLFLLIWGVTYLVMRAGLLRSLLGAAIVGAISVGVLQALARFAASVKGVRIFDLIHLAATAPALILVRDQSISDRVAAIVFSLGGALNYWLLPHGFTSWSAWVAEIGPRMVRYVPYYTAGDRIMSGYGAAIFELGFLGLLIPYVVTRTVRLRYGHDKQRFLTVAVVLNLLLLTALPLAYPPIGFLIGYFCYYGIRRSTTIAGDRQSATKTVDSAPVPV